MLNLSYKGAVRAAAVALYAAVPTLGHAQEEPYDIYLSMSYSGNDWQAEASNMIKALAASSDYADKANLEVQVAGPNTQRQIQQINAMVQAGADAIVVYPISPTALNNVVRSACSRGVAIIAYDGEITEPCAYNVTINQSEAGRKTAEWLVDQLDGEGDIILVKGVPGTSVDTARTQAAKEVFAQHDGINVIGEADGMWSQAVARTELNKLMSTRDWSDVDGLWMQVGCYTANAMQLESGIAPEDVAPCAGEGSNGGRIQMLPLGTEVDGAELPYAPFGAPRISYAAPPYSGAMAFKLAVDILEGKEVDKRTELPLPLITNETVQLCETGSWDEQKAGCNVFNPSLVSNPGWFASIFSEELPQLGLDAALEGLPEN
ncbi:substrate-binding domain-containing protein [Halomonas sp. ATBC28]|uniref:sugar ABC transporter substrate-binding protein n=1 Tax=Halomonas sp. ATBC28 TaxID=2545264 RepID=UPI00110DEBDA|nr:sugar ABC transporter substrate-binding protein [Halomonas sp. ATBC28]TMU23127.1 substrate-binding domain-containing protein [Halomonas sp. ATBC28]